MTEGRVTALTYYPVKGCRGVPVDSAYLGPAGLIGDRLFCLVNAGGRVLSQRLIPAMATIEVVPGDATVGGIEPGTEERPWLVTRAGMPGLTLTATRSGPSASGDFLGKVLEGVDQGDAAAGWFSAALDTPCRLIMVPAVNTRRCDGMTGGPVGFADSGAVLVTSESSLDQLNERVSGPALPMERFRPNIVVGGWARAHTEDTSPALEVGRAALGGEKAAKRCRVTTVDQRAGVVTGPEPLATLAGYRRGRPGGVYFGYKFAVTREAPVRVGDPVRIASGNGRTGG